MWCARAAGFLVARELSKPTASQSCGALLDRYQKRVHTGRGAVRAQRGRARARMCARRAAPRARYGSCFRAAPRRSSVLWQCALLWSRARAAQGRGARKKRAKRREAGAVAPPLPLSPLACCAKAGIKKLTCQARPAAEPLQPPSPKKGVIRSGGRGAGAPHQKKGKISRGGAGALSKTRRACVSKGSKAPLLLLLLLL
jgi:hypothetical protein